MQNGSNKSTSVSHLFRSFYANFIWILLRLDAIWTLLQYHTEKLQSQCTSQSIEDRKNKKYFRFSRRHSQCCNWKCIKSGFLQLAINGLLMCVMYILFVAMILSVIRWKERRKLKSFFRSNKVKINCCAIKLWVCTNMCIAIFCVVIQVDLCKHSCI